MALTTAQQVRRTISDPWRRKSEVQYGDGTASGFQLSEGAPYSMISAATASVPITGWSATGATIDTALGYAEFSGVISASSAVRFDYQWAVFSDDEVSYFTAAGGGTVNGAALKAIDALMFDSYKRARWAAPDGSMYDDSKAVDNLVKMRSAISAQVVQDIAPGGGFASWAENQENYS